MLRSSNLLKEIHLLPRKTFPDQQIPTSLVRRDSFASAFSDVTPDDWAYQAVIQLASPPLKCFPYTPRQ